MKMDGETYTIKHKTMNQLPLSKVAVDECGKDEQRPTAVLMEGFET